MITSQGGSVEWRFTQNPTGHDYGHHMSKVTETPHFNYVNVSINVSIY
jgi:hypothetical protein